MTIKGLNRSSGTCEEVFPQIDTLMGRKHLLRILKYIQIMAMLMYIWR